MRVLSTETTTSSGGGGGGGRKSVTTAPGSQGSQAGTDTDETRTGPALHKDSSPSRELDLLAGEVVSSQTITSRSRTVETTTYSLENEGNTETRVEQKVTLQSDGDPIDHDEALAQAIQEATAMNPDMTVEKIEIHQTAQLSEQ